METERDPVFGPSHAFPPLFDRYHLNEVDVWLNARMNGFAPGENPLHSRTLL